MRHECIILAESPGALVEVCGISVLERLLRQLQRLGLTKAIVLCTTPDVVAQHLARPSPNRARVALDIRLRSPDNWPKDTGRFLVVAGDRILDSRLLKLLDEQNSAAALVDSAPPATLQPLIESEPETPRGRLCGAALLEPASVQSRPGPFPEMLRDQIAAGQIETIDLASRDWNLPSLRRTLRPYWCPAPAPAQQKNAEYVLLDAAQKWALDFPAMVHAPIENFLISHLCKTPITPNQLTVFTNVAAWSATFLFATGHLGWGVLLALIVGVLDGLDGKQARVKIETSKAGKLEHWFDALFENSWWIALAYFLQSSGLLPNAFAYLALLIAAEIVAGLAKWSVLRFCGRTIDEIGDFNRVVRLVGGRRNIYVWLLAVGILFGAAAEAYKIVTWWGALTAAVQVPRAAFTVRAHRKMRPVGNFTPAT
ncbi:MAG: CDP-alcohol phosphatidyltransferase family protein [Chthoniobacterales bacterium]|nr:CDP-alcohol phosphatidyltransferase family protein [Chthoniobacterales bacterium]